MIEQERIDRMASTPLDSSSRPGETPARPDRETAENARRHESGEWAPYFVRQERSTIYSPPCSRLESSASLELKSTPQGFKKQDDEYGQYASG